MAWPFKQDTTQLAEVQQQLAAVQSNYELLAESYADLTTLYRDDIGWQKIGMTADAFGEAGRDVIAQRADVMATANALIKRGLAVRCAYIWGQGVQVSIEDDGAEGQDVGAIFDAFWAEPSNRAELTSSEAQVRLERRLGTRGEAFYAFPTDPLTGRVRVRHIPAKEIVSRVCDPEDAATVWLYKRVWAAVTVDPRTGQEKREDRTTYYPALGFWPLQRARSWGGHEIRWDAPVRMIAVNCPDEDWRGVGDALPALPWAKLDKEFLEDLGLYMRAMTRILGQVTAKNGKAATAAARAAQGAQPATAGNPNGVASWVGTDPNTTLSLVSKSGAQIDSDSHLPFATMVAAALEIPVTMLLGDPGVRGNRATAETLDQPTELMARLRQEVHGEFFRDLAGYVIDMAVVAPRGPLHGAVARDGDRLIVTLLDGDQRTANIDWPEFSSTPIETLIKAIAAADQTESFPHQLAFTLLCKAFEIEDVDEWLDRLTDDDGNWLGLDALQALAQDRQDQRGEGEPMPPAEDEQETEDGQ